MSDNTRTPRVRKGQGEVTLSREEFERRLRERFADPAFDAAGDALQRIVDIAWTACHTYRKTPRTRKAGPGFADPDFDLPVEWLDTRERIQLASASTRIGQAARACCSSVAPRGPTRPAPARCRRRTG
jgi:hypothetical protein